MGNRCRVEREQPPSSWCSNHSADDGAALPSEDRQSRLTYSKAMYLDPIGRLLPRAVDLTARGARSHGPSFDSRFWVLDWLSRACSSRASSQLLGTDLGRRACRRLANNAPP